jgi:hypothetical protein
MQTSSSAIPSTLRFSAKTSGRHRLASQERLPVPVGTLLVDEHGTVLAAVSDQLRVPVSLDTQPPDESRPSTGFLNNAVRT